MKNQCVQILVLVFCLSFLVDTKQAAAEISTIVDIEKTVGTNTVKTEEYQKELLDIAFRAASVLPSNPFVKEKSRKQEEVFNACIELGELELASEYAGKIENWRRSKCCGELAIIYAKGNNPEQAKRYISLADDLYDEKQEWRNDEIKINIAKSYAYMREYDQALSFASSLDKESHITRIYGIKAILENNSEEFDQAFSIIDKYTSTKKYYPVIYSMEVMVDLYGQYYGQVDKRNLIESKILDLFICLPHIFAFEFTVDLCEIAIENNDKDKTLELIERLSSLVYTTKFEWRLEDKIYLSAKLAALRYQAGQKEKAHKELSDSYNLFKAEGEKIGSMFRGRPLRMLAESYHVVIGAEKSLEIYKLALKHAVINPNTRPQAADLTSTCCSLALNKIKPDDQLMKQIKEIYKDFN